MQPLLNASKEWEIVPAGSLKERTIEETSKNKLIQVTSWRAKKIALHWNQGETSL